jgi:biopolymer transport protein ExbB
MAMLEKALEYWRAGGLLLAPIAVVCFGIWLYFLKSRAEMLAGLRAARDIDEELVAQLRSAGRGEVARNYADRSGMIAKLIAHALGRGGDPLDNFDRAAGQCRRWLRRDLLVLGGLTAAAPLLGLLGTVRGMIATFTGVAAGSEAADFVAAGISQALITTQVGLVVAIPGVFGIARLQRLLNTVGAAMDSCRLHLSLGLKQEGEA